MRNYEFRLTPAYCLYNGIAVKNQQGSKICFLAENPDDAMLRERVSKAFKNYLEYVNRQEDCPEIFKSKPGVYFVAGNRTELRLQVSRLYSQNENTQSLMKGVANETKNNSNEEAAAVLLLDTLLTQARKQNATDIHIEKNSIRFRIMGKLEFITTLSEDKCKELIQRIKFLAGMNVLEKRRSQEGHFVYGETEPIFVRVSTVGVVGSKNNGLEESVVVRLLDTKRLPLCLEKLGFNIPQLSVINSMSKNPNGLILICGPTGSGKSTTAAALLLDIKQQRKDEVKIISLEDPPEYIIPGITQIQIDEKVNNSFSEALMHIFRQDPDVLMIGEIRDENSAAVAIRAALTGHLVIATLHTASAAGAVLRLENLGIPRNLIVSVLKGVIVQELNDFMGNVNLVADTALPSKKLETAMESSLSENELEALFEHTTNYTNVLNKTIQVLKQKHSVKVEQPESNTNKSKTSESKKAVILPLIVPPKKKQNSKKAVG
ncbi:MAG: Flp pilus assembly complex ATPase component TadA [Treponema sp.]|nr:Flp pilus assembly complex ATPase component TadA [Treponema sp.]